MRLLLLLIVSAFLLFSCNDSSKTISKTSKIDTLTHDLCVYQINDTGYQVGYLTRLIRDTFVLAQDTVKYSKDSTEFNLTGKKKWMQDTIYLIDLTVNDSLTKKPLKNIAGKDSIRQYFLNKSFILADCSKNMETILGSKKLKPFVEKK